MKHWVTNQEMGEGFEHNQKEHKNFEYNILVKPKKYEKNIMRTFYLIKDIWTLEQLEELKEFLDEHIEERRSN
tara:strand:- start:2104 stop:2322 length:219 start_codon:yes stop_codon:yes gene_type:complete